MQSLFYLFMLILLSFRRSNLAKGHNDCNPKHHYWTESELFNDLFHSNTSTSKKYNKMLRPVSNSEDVIVVEVKMHFQQLVEIDEINHIMIASVWIEQTWRDAHLKWNPQDYGGLTSIRIPADYIWLPEMALFDNADGNYTIRQRISAKLYHDGTVNWKPPAMYKSACNIDVTYFPYDTQLCYMKLGSLSYSAAEVDISIEDDKVNMDRLISNGEWNIKETVAKLWQNNHPHHEVAFAHPKVIFIFKLQRLPFFFTVFLITPCLGISFITGLVFCIPPESQEKITLCISVLLAHTFYLLVIAEMMPASSKTLPLIAEYLLFTLTFITLSIILSTIVLNIHYRSSITHRPIPPFLKKFIYGPTPTFLWLVRPTIQEQQTELTSSKSVHIRLLRNLNGKEKSEKEKKTQQVITASYYIASRMQLKIKQNQEILEWKFAASVLDRIFFFIFMAISICGTIILVIHASLGSSN